MSTAQSFARRLTVRPGWRAALAAVALAGAGMWLLVETAGGDEWLVARGAVIAVGLLAGGVTIGSNTAIGLAAVPALGAAIVGLDRSTGVAWWQALVIGLLWYLASESAWASISARAGVVRTLAIRNRRVGEVATVVAVTAGLATAGLVASALAPTRTALVKGIAVALILAAVLVVGRLLLALANRHRATSAP